MYAIKHAPAQMLLLDASGRVMANNEGWASYRDAHPIGGTACTPGQSYIEYCDRVGRLFGDDRQVFERVLGNVREVLERDVDEERFEFPVRTEHGTHWYSALVSRFSNGGQARAAVTFADVTAERYERQRDRLLGRFSDLLAVDLTCEETYERVAQVGLGMLGDAALVDCVDQGARIRRMAVASVEPAQTPELALVNTGTWALQDAPAAVRAAVEEREPVILPDLRGESLFAIAPRGAPAASLMKIGARSAMVLPLKARGRVVGVLTLLWSSPERMHGDWELALGEELAERAAIAIANACEFSELKDAARARDEVLAVLTHDLRNPIHTISLAADLLLSQPTEPDTSVKHLRTISRVAGDMNGLIQDLLDASRLGAGEFPVRLQPVEVEPMIREIVENQEYSAAERGVALQGVIIGDVPPVLGDRDRLLQVFTNLVQNAKKFTTPDGMIRIEAERRGDEVRFAVKDNGCGIPANDLGHVFDRYWQAKGDGRKGAGLGLSIVKGIIEAHGGRIWVESAVDVGTSFFFSLPIAERVERPAAKAAAA